VSNLLSYIDVRSLEDDFSATEKTARSILRGSSEVSAEQALHCPDLSPEHEAELDVRKDYKSFQALECTRTAMWKDENKLNLYP
jgi:hypothetical protein